MVDRASLQAKGNGCEKYRLLRFLCAKNMAKKIELNVKQTLLEKVVCRNFRQTTQHGALEGKTQSKDVKYYNLDVIISVGYHGLLCFYTEPPIRIAKSAEIECDSGMFSKEISKIGLFFFI